MYASPIDRAGNLQGYNLSLKALLWLIADLTGRRPPSIELPHRAIFPIAFTAEAIAKASYEESQVTNYGLRGAKGQKQILSNNPPDILGGFAPSTTIRVAP
jgi:dihydroflavonol-4-reductase